MKKINIPNTIIFHDVEESIARGESFVVPLAGQSMNPTLNEGDSLTLGPIIPPLKKGDVILFRYHGLHLLHRITAINGRHITTQGDNCATQEEITQQDVVAQLLAVQKPDGKFLDCNSNEWHRLSHKILTIKKLRQTAQRGLGYKARRIETPLYFICLLLLMWGPVGVIGIPLNNFVFGIRLDHLLHASVYIPCAWFLMDKVHSQKSGSGKLLLFLILIAIGTEIVQYWIPYRGFDINDLAANFFGVTVGWFLVILYRRKTSPKGPRT